MRLRNIPAAEEAIADSSYVIHEPQAYKGKFKTLFKNENPVHIEIGMGKGKFLAGMAGRYPDINYIGIERYSSVLLRALQKIDQMEEKPDNLKFMCIDAGEIINVFGKEEVDRIYLNFSDPWPKKRHAKRRLPSKEFLRLYDQILKKEGQLEFKTDNRELFDFAVKELPIANWKVRQITYDLHHDEIMNMGNIMTEYEEKFSSKGNPIYKYIIVR